MTEKPKYHEPYICQTCKCESWKTGSGTCDCCGLELIAKEQAMTESEFLISRGWACVPQQHGWNDQWEITIDGRVFSTDQKWQAVSFERQATEKGSGVDRIIEAYNASWRSKNPVGNMAGSPTADGKFTPGDGLRDDG